MQVLNGRIITPDIEQNKIQIEVRIGKRRHNMRIVTLTSETKQNLLENLLKRSTNDYGEYEKVVAEIIEQVKSRKEECYGRI